VAEQHPDEIEALLRYILLAGGEHSVDEVRRSILLHVPTAEAPLASAGEQLIQQGILRGVQQGVQQGIQQGVQQGIQQGIQQGVQQGIQQGIQQGREEGILTALRGTLRRHLTLRFGHVETTHAAVIDAAPKPELEQMLDRVLTATSAEEVLSDR
jgi:flagellar biosynthesis/type III secretory pathway protein FliH